MILKINLQDVTDNIRSTKQYEMDSINLSPVTGATQREHKSSINIASETAHMSTHIKYLNQNNMEKQDHFLLSN